MKNLFFVDCEANAPCPGFSHGRGLTEFGCVHYDSLETFHGKITNDWHEDVGVWQDFSDWVVALTPTDQRAVFVSDNVAYDWQWINYGLHHSRVYNPFGHSGRRISDFYAGLRGDFRKTQEWKRLRVTKHDHNPVNDAMGNVEAFKRILEGER